MKRSCFWRAPPQAELEPKLATMRALEQKQGLVQSGLAQYADADPERLKALRETMLFLQL